MDKMEGRRNRRNEAGRVGAKRAEENTTSGHTEMKILIKQHHQNYILLPLIVATDCKPGKPLVHGVQRRGKEEGDVHNQNMPNQGNVTPTWKTGSKEDGSPTLGVNNGGRRKCNMGLNGNKESIWIIPGNTLERSDKSLETRIIDKKQRGAKG
ncbi:hypothetical protein L1987_58667 [Smallanthus sonchifolius]|uniref:Uncharacterized protein n=1 Tax=Smallanthus sonchifolius TaxID=185202 RepID=A0ACB9D3N0_9ASTR|nr:hypothetical protein L1987_58667 [Smallanthus sonchifolius]